MQGCRVFLTTLAFSLAFTSGNSGAQRIYCPATTRTDGLRFHREYCRCPLYQLGDL